MTKFVYTVCSANHLAHCKTMADSFCSFNSGYKVIIGLIDKIEGRFDKNLFNPYILIEAGDIELNGFSEMSSIYSVIELNCAMKPFFAQFIFKHYNPDILLYLDSDIWVMNNFQEIEQLLVDKSIVLTPHMTTPFPDLNKLPTERDVLKSGLYNAGFIGMKNTPVVSAFLEWWGMHMRTECFYNFAEGMGVDQVWLNFVPLYFDQVAVFEHKGANVAYWNLHERQLSRKDGSIWINNESPLIFLHISGYNFIKKDQLSRHQNRFVLNDIPLLNGLYEEYAVIVRQNGYNTFSEMPCFYAKKKKKPTGILAFINRLLGSMGMKLIKL